MPDGLTIEETMTCEGISRREVFNRIATRELQRVESAGRRTLIAAESLSLQGRQRWLEMQLAQASIQSEAQPSQPELFLPDAISALKLPYQQLEVVCKRWEICKEAVNGNWRGMGFDRKRDFVYCQLGQKYGVSGRSIERWGRRLRETISPDRPNGDPAVLMDRAPGPHPSGNGFLEDWVVAEARHQFMVGKLTKRQVYEKMLRKIAEKQAAWGPRDLYPIPSYRALCRVLTNLPALDHAARGGTDALKQASGYIDRSYRDLPSLGRVETDEWIVDALAYSSTNKGKVGRYYLLTFFDARALYPLVWSLVEHPNESDEIDLLTALIDNYGVPGMIHSDRGRFRGRVFGGKFISADRKQLFSQADGILDRLEIRRNTGREHNPRGSRLERFHKELANFARTLPGWVGANTDERKMAPGDTQKAEHDLWVRGRAVKTPLLSRDELLERISAFMQEWRERPSQRGRDMDGCAPSRVFEDSKPQGGFRRISAEELAWHTAEHFLDELIEPAGIITLPDGNRYSHPLLLMIQGERRECVRLRGNHAAISVLPAAKGEEMILATLRSRVGNADAAALAAAHELQGRVRSAVQQYISAGNGESQQQEIIPRSADAVPARDFFPEQAVTVETLPEERPVPDLYDFEPPTVEKV